MFKIQYDITDQMDLFHYFAKRGDESNAALQVAILAEKFRIAPLDTLEQTIKANGNKFDVKMAKKLIAEIKDEIDESGTGDKLDQILELLHEARRTNNTAIIKHYCKYAQKMLDEVIEAL